EKSLLLGGQRLLIIGYGSIARRLVELLAPFRFDVTAFRRSVRGDENCPTQPIDQIDAHLPDADIVINILPASEATRQFFDASRFDRLKRGAIYINIGRGDTTDQDALMSALNAGQVSQAFLDVTSPEPLPADHPLWQTPGCHITPHTAGGTRDEPQRMADYFLANLKRFASGEEPVNRLV
ncbi:MAG TPA: NAD(P)-dependent oxidoreductase, partial [Tepidisphaeraceae bacterium]